MSMITWLKKLLWQPKPQPQDNPRLKLKEDLFKEYETIEAVLYPLSVQEKTGVYNLTLDPNWKHFEKYVKNWLALKLQKLISNREDLEKVLNHSEMIQMFLKFPILFKNTALRNTIPQENNPETDIQLD